MGARPKLAGTVTAPLAERLRERIARDGPIGIADYMQACLADEREGYYASRDPLGAAGDFVTSPEVSQIFGELLGLWTIAVWQTMGAPKSIVVAELGPGRGTLLADASRAWRSMTQFAGCVSLALVETSPTLREIQKKALSLSRQPVQWCETIDDVPRGRPLIVLANEFLDALPIRQLVRRAGLWRERRIALGPHNALTFADGDIVDDDTLPVAPDSAILEMRPATAPLLASLVQRASEVPLAALFIDYGHAKSGLGDTLQAVRRHRFADPLASPGETDLTAHVDFAALKHEAAALGLRAYGPMPQGEFLLKLGLGERRDRLLEGARPEQRELISSGAARLVDPRQMGLLFKALALASDGLAPPPPFGDI
ncbi:MAG TPA: SAM-dependent methyltransferase [Methyloceanibacter sp.]|nr:SAM-dependent methyltransferase [Methyloceanibacter sp.]